MRKIALGIVGCGVIGKRHVQAAAASPLVELVAVADAFEDRGRAVAEEFHIPRFFREGSDLVANPGIEAVVLAIPAGGRAALACDALRAGKHVLLEKPAAMHANEIREMMRLQGDRVVACCSARFRFLPGFEAARAAFAAGSLGELREIYCRAIFGAEPAPTQPPPAWRLSRAQNGGGILVNWGSYDLDYLMSITGWLVKPRSVFARTWPVAPHLSVHVAPGSDAESHCLALIRCEGGEMIHIERAEFSSLHTETAWQLIGTRASLRLQMGFTGEKRVLFDDTDTKTGVSSRVLWEGVENESDYDQGPVKDFVSAIIENRPPKTDLHKALTIQQIFDAVYASSETGKLVDIPAS